MDTGKYIAAGLLNFKKGFESLDSVAEIEWKTLHDSKISFFDLKFDINCVKRDLEIKISTLDSRNWLDFKKYFEIMQHPDFFKEQGFSQGFLKEQFDFLENRTYSIKDSQKNCKIEANPFTNNRRKIVESVYYSIIIPCTKYKSFFGRGFTSL